jgi:hypothetical protein
VKEYILEVKKLIPEEYCKKIISYYDNNLITAQTVGGENRKIRNCDTRPITKDSFGKKICFNYIEKTIFDCVSFYEKSIEKTDVNKISSLEILKYVANEYDAGYKFHRDFGTEVTKRAFSISICLNNSFTGGEFVFDLGKEGKIQYPQNIGDAVMFPSNFMFPHQVNKVTKGIRYAIIGWVY